MSQENVYDAVRDIWANNKLAQDVFDFGQTHGQSVTNDEFVALQRELDPALLDAEDRIDGFEDEMETRMAIVRQIQAEDAEMGMNILSSQADDALRELQFIEKVYSEAVENTDYRFQPLEQQDSPDKEEPLLHILRSWLRGLRCGRHLGTEECDWLVKLFEHYDAPLREKLQVRLGAVMCLELAVRGGHWGKDAASARRALASYDAVCVKTVDPGERMTQLHYLNEGDMVTMIDFMAAARRLVARYKMTLEEAVDALRGDESPLS